MEDGAEYCGLGIADWELGGGEWRVETVGCRL
jgi:hypothetical protein